MSAEFRILVAEDDENDRFFLRRAAEKAGVKNTIDFVNNGQEAVDYLSGTEAFSDRNAYPLPTILLLDLKMPLLDGFDVLKWVREHPRLGRLPVIVLSTSNLQEDVDRCYNLGANSYLMKPTETGKLQETVIEITNYWLGLNRCPECE
ncbi:MAG TPA: response regulator [Candidatus Dormibacteraeota bacterium]|nr:response regulator [Candidatus Dormibacteraeota bacterium]